MAAAGRAPVSCRRMHTGIFSFFALYSRSSAIANGFSVFFCRFREKYPFCRRLIAVFAADAVFRPDAPACPAGQERLFSRAKNNIGL